MPCYRIHRLKDHLRQAFRQSPHVGGAAVVKPRDYSAVEPAETVDASSPYSAYFQMRETEAPLAPGDLLESPGGDLRIYKFVGFEPAQWVLPEVKGAPPDFSAAPPDLPPASPERAPA